MQNDGGWAPCVLRRGRHGKAIRQERDNPWQDSVSEGGLLNHRLLFLFGRPCSIGAMLPCKQRVAGASPVASIFSEPMLREYCIIED